jgi:archaellum biogenesis protein FlaJ (TadC family)
MAKKEGVEKPETSKAGFYVKASNALFYNLSNSLIEQGKFKGLRSELRTAGMSIFSASYISVMFFSSLLVLIGTFIIIMLLAITSLGFLVIIRNLGLAVLLGGSTFLVLYFYPSIEKGSLKSKIDDELPFVALHMSAIAGSGIEPSKIFEILTADEENRAVAGEFRKIVNQVNIYGYDIITVLKNVAKETASKKFAELLNGMAMTISEGGQLSDFLAKRSETLFFDYKLSRERYTKLAETFMNIYISVVITAPMIFSLLILLMGVSGFGGGLSPATLTTILILGVSVMNVIFLIALHLKQPSY